MLFRATTGSRPRNLGRASIGLGLMLLALHLLVGTVAPDGISPAARELVAAATREPVPVLLATTLVAWAMHSSVAAVLVTASLAGAGLVGPTAALAMVLGANLGSALNPLAEALGGERLALRLPVGNLANRLVGCALALPFLGALPTLLAQLDPDPGRQVALFHLLLNLGLALLFLGPLPATARALERLLPDRLRPDDPGTPRYLDPASLVDPAVALANAAREVLRMADVVEAMLRGAREMVRQDDLRRLAELRREDDVLDRLHRAVKVFLAELGRQPLEEVQLQRLSHILAAALNLEHAGDILDKGLLSLLAKRMKRRLRFSPAELAEIDGMHEHLLSQLRLAAAVLMGEDLEAARRLVEEKERFRELERAVTEAQIERLTAGDQPGETETLELDLVRDLKRVEAHLAAIAHPLLERSNLLHRSRLVRL